jgi:hypothetical protein
MDLRRRAVRRLYGLALLALLVAAPAMAEDMCAVPSVASADDAIAKFDALRRHDCLGGAECSTAQCKLVSNMLAKNQGAKGAPIGQMQSMLGTLNDTATSLSETQPGVAQLHGMQARWKLGELAKTDAKSAMTQILAANTKEWQGQNFLVFSSTPFEVNVQDHLSHCTSPASCESEFASLVNVYTLSDLIDRTLKIVTRDQLDEFDKKIHQLDERWTAFHNKSLAVLPWELAFNNLFYRSSNAGFSGPPNYQWLLLHPSAALVYDTRQSDKLQPALLLDLIGRYQWTWSGRNGSDIALPWGAALAMSWHGNSPGYGFSVHLPRNWSLGLTASHTSSQGTQVQFIVSSEVARFITDKEKNVQELRTNLESLH